MVLSRWIVKEVLSNFSPSPWVLGRVNYINSKGKEAALKQILRIWFKKWTPELGTHSWLSVPVPRQVWDEQKKCPPHASLLSWNLCQLPEACVFYTSNSTCMLETPGGFWSSWKVSLFKDRQELFLSWKMYKNWGNKRTILWSHQEILLDPLKQRTLSGIWEVSPRAKAAYHFMWTTHTW